MAGQYTPSATRPPSAGHSSFATRSPASSRIAGTVLVGGIGSLLVAALLAYFAYAATVEDVPDYGGTYIEGTLGPPPTLVSILAQDETARTISQLVFNGLTAYAPDGTIVPDLATGWEMDAESRSYTFSLRNDVTWHDGTPFTVDDVLFTFGLLSSPEHAHPVWSNIAVERLGDRAVRIFVLNNVYAPLLEYATIGILPRHLLDGITVDQIPLTSFNLQPVGTGPYRVVEVTEEHALLRVNEVYFNGRPRIRFIKFKFYPNAKATITALERGEVEGVSYLPPAEASRVEDLADVQAYSAPLAGYTVLYFNLRREQFFERTVRHAIAHAIDRDYLAREVLAGAADPLESPILPHSWAYFESVARYPYDPQKSRTLLEQAGWKIGADGVRGKEGKRLSLTLLTVDAPDHLKLAEAIGEQLAVVGIAVDVQAVRPSGLLSDYLLTREFDIALYTWLLDGLDPDPYVTWHSSQIQSGWNFAGFIDPRVDEALQNARHTLDLNERKVMYADFQRMFAEEAPSLMLLTPRYSFAVRTTVRGVRVPLVLPTVESRLAEIDRWYIRTRKNVTRVRSPLEGWRLPFLG